MYASVVPVIERIYDQTVPSLMRWTDEIEAACKVEM